MAMGSGYQCGARKATCWPLGLGTPGAPNYSEEDPDDMTIELPLKLRNRRRIWSLLEEARVRDVSGIDERLMAARMDGEKRGFALAAVPSSLPADFNPREVPGFGPPSCR